MGVGTFVLLLACMSTQSIALKKGPKMSDPEADNVNLVNHDDGIFDPAIIPSHLIVQDDVASSDVKPGLPLDPNDFGQAELLNNPEIMFDDTETEDPIMMANLFQGDIRISSSDELFSLTSHATVGISRGAPHVTRNAIIDAEKKWKGGVIPYQISSEYNMNERATIAKGIAEIHRYTCIKFTPQRHERDYIYIKKGNGCSSAVGRSGGQQTVSLGKGCIYFGIVIHELVHAIGLWHEQSRQDRDSFVRIYWNNIKKNMEYNFQKYNWDMIQNLGVSYDTGSIMHYSEKAFAIDRTRPTIKAKNGAKIGQRNELSKKDVEKINRLYKCGGGGGGGPVGPTPITKPPPIPIPDNCIDNSKFCRSWAKTGECKRNPLWMNPNCRKSCKQCGICKDENKFCGPWSEQGECTKSSDYMMYHCKKSCNLCGPGVTTNCLDENEYCRDWAKVGECKANPRYMKKHCRKSCQVC